MYTRQVGQAERVSMKQMMIGPYWVIEKNQDVLRVLYSSLRLGAFEVLQSHRECSVIYHLTFLSEARTFF